MIGLIPMCVCYLKGMNLVEVGLRLGLHRGVGMIGGCKFSCMLGGGSCAFVLVDLEALHHFIYDGVDVLESQFVNHYASFSDLRVSFSEVVFEIIPFFIRLICAFPRTDVVFENSLFVEDNKGKVYCLTLGEFILGC